jgi:ABC-type spermidine/putrescine transport system permease subunit II
MIGILLLRIGAFHSPSMNSCLVATVIAIFSFLLRTLSASLCRYASFYFQRLLDQ